MHKVCLDVGSEHWRIKHIIKSFTYATNVNSFETHTALKFETKCFRRVRVKNMLGGWLVLIFFFSPFWHNFTSAWFYCCLWLVTFIAQQLMKKYSSDLDIYIFQIHGDYCLIIPREKEQERKQGGNSQFPKISHRSFVRCLIPKVFSDIWD